jgi:hypothetical protein
MAREAEASALWALQLVCLGPVADGVATVSVLNSKRPARGCFISGAYHAK